MPPCGLSRYTSLNATTTAAATPARRALHRRRIGGAPLAAEAAHEGEDGDRQEPDGGDQPGAAGQREEDAVGGAQDPGIAIGTRREDVVADREVVAPPVAVEQHPLVGDVVPDVFPPLDAPVPRGAEPRVLAAVVAHEARHRLDAAAEAELALLADGHGPSRGVEHGQQGRHREHPTQHPREVRGRHGVAHDEAAEGSATAKGHHDGGRRPEDEVPPSMAVRSRGRRPCEQRGQHDHERHGDVGRLGEKQRAARDRPCGTDHGPHQRPQDQEEHDDDDDGRRPGDATVDELHHPRRPDGDLLPPEQGVDREHEAGVVERRQPPHGLEPRVGADDPVDRELHQSETDEHRRDGGRRVARQRGVRAEGRHQHDDEEHLPDEHGRDAGVREPLPERQVEDQAEAEQPEGARQLGRRRRCGRAWCSRTHVGSAARPRRRRAGRAITPAAGGRGLRTDRARHGARRAAGA